MLSSDPAQIKISMEIGHQLVELVENAKWSSDGDAADLREIHTQAKGLAAKAFPSGIWPSHLQPMPYMLGRLAEGYKDKGLWQEALKFSLTGVLSMQQRIGPEWVHEMFKLTQTFSGVFIYSGQSAKSSAEALPKDIDLWAVFHGYLGELASSSRSVYGADATYTRAIQKWYLEAVESAGEPQVGSEDFTKRFESEQSKLLKWAGISRDREIILIPSSTIHKYSRNRKANLKV